MKRGLYSRLKEAKMEERKPPLGLKPKWIHDGQRIREIFEAMERFSDAGEPIPREWIDELRELVTSK